MATDPLRIYWDSCAYVSCISGTAGRVVILRQILQLAKDKEIVFVMSPLIIAEVVKLEDNSIDAATQAKTIREFFENDYFAPRALDRRTAEESAEITRRFGLKPPDAIHVATAIRAKCYSLQTYDGEQGEARRLLRFDGLIGTPALRIELPTLPPTASKQQPLAFGGPSPPP